jgi:2-polyprenyl-3-methyl-5-hydroxy-6-metoxy-1,4-benzoquinol methylase
MVQNPEKSWAAFWKNQTHSFDEVMKVSTSYFARRFIEKFKIAPTDELFDYGCGPGFLADSLATFNIKITGADINPSFVDQCKKNHPEANTFLITVNPNANQAILNDNLKEKKFDFIILLSISQYLESVQVLESIIGLLKGYLSVRGKIIVADVVDPKTSSLRDLIAIKLLCIRSGKTIAFVRFFFYLLFSNYRRLSLNVHLLHISEENMNGIARKTSLRCEKVNKLTVHPTRTNYVFTR